MAESDPSEQRPGDAPDQPGPPDQPRSPGQTPHPTRAAEQLAKIKERQAEQAAKLKEMQAKVNKTFRHSPVVLEQQENGPRTSSCGSPTGSPASRGR